MGGESYRFVEVFQLSFNQGSTKQWRQPGYELLQSDAIKNALLSGPLLTGALIY